MKNLLAAALILGTLAGFAGESGLAARRPPKKQHPGFEKLEEAVEFLVACLQDDRFKDLAGACIGRRGGRPLFPRTQTVFGVLKRRHEKTPLAQLYAETEFPEEGMTFKLGGHFSELGHIHIDFEKQHRRWYIADIWMCR